MTVITWDELEELWEIWGTDYAAYWHSLGRDEERPSFFEYVQALGCIPQDATLAD
ncbi:TPA: hypothetical protein QBF83_004242 [Escherichia coli O128:H2]|uniref:hypothetical protein n=1 Tax=Escherichia coli TaxID=562 RepID=UPI001CDA03B9|nr:hypothetical protein [Escherichia coli]HDQ6808576.1 hypothetical protein [Escherichia coli O22:H16]HDQ6829350.1 hypothetical protein [Escherichia coli O128:H2]EIB5669068.1 hypothetical protein [Escherichia coli]EKB0198015.1 hypothetical protein [Escherichia coli]MCA2038567.1 hypothetical protein [Escherichia coli]